MPSTLTQTKSLVCLLLLVGTFILLALPGMDSAYAEPSWPRLPTDAEISQAKERFIADNTFTSFVDSRECAEQQCAQLTGSIEQQECLAQCANIDRARALGPHLPVVTESKVTDWEIIKAHDPEGAKVDRVAASYVFLLFTKQETRVDPSDHSRREQVAVYGIATLDYLLAGNTEFWLFHDANWEKYNTREQRDKEIAAFFDSGRLVRGFPGETTGTPNRPPQVKLTYSPQNPAPSDTVYFKADASDPDGDALTFRWFLNDQIIGAAKQPEYKWENPGAGLHIITVMVSDGKGGMAEDAVTLALGNRSLCDEAIAYFGGRDALRKLGIDPDRSNIAKDYTYILADFHRAIARYNELHPDRPAYVSASVVGGFRTINWLGDHGGVVPGDVGKKLAREFVFEDPNDAIRDRDGAALRQRPPGQEKYKAKPGTEPALYDAIVAQFENTKKPLTLGEVFYLALEQRNGDARQAMLLAHNMMRSLARGQIESGGDPELTGVAMHPEFFEKYVEVIRNGEDKSGPVYHFFGMAFFEMQMRGDMGMVTGLATLKELLSAARTGLHQGLDFGPLIKAFYDAIEERWSGDTETAASRFSNTFEQFIREGISKSPKDPEKYCFNVWGAKLGAELWKLLGGSIVSSPWGPPGAPKTIEMPKCPGCGNLGPITPVGVNRYGVTIYQSPVSIAWESENHSILFDQETESIYGFYPNLVVIPLYEEDSGTWGAIFIDYGWQPHRETLNAAGDGTLHMMRIDFETRKAASYVVNLSRGDTFSMQVQPGDVSSHLVKGDGETIEPEVVALPPETISSEAIFVESPSPTPSGPFETRILPEDLLGILFLVGLGLLLLVIAALIIRHVRRQSLRSTPAEQKRQASRKKRTRVAVEGAEGKARSRGSRKTADHFAGICPRCGNPIRPGVRFCDQCSALLAGQAVPPEQVICPQCGHPNSPQARFCHHCGIRLPTL